MEDNINETEHQGLKYAYEFTFEESYNSKAAIRWMRENWTSAFLASAVYLAVIFGVKKYMESRSRFELRGPLTLWSGVLAIFSIFGCIRTMPELYHVLNTHGWTHSVCSPSYFYGTTGVWSFLFTLSKAYELGDTLFIVLRKQPLILLHWYHHVTVLIYTWSSYGMLIGPGRWFMAMNFVIHSFMYSYYTLKAMRFRLPIQIGMFITFLQISQMFTGLLINYSTYQAKKQGLYCNQTRENMIGSTLMYLSYFMLFIVFFYNSYVSKKSLKRIQAKEEEKKAKTEKMDEKMKRQ